MLYDVMIYMQYTHSINITLPLFNMQMLRRKIDHCHTPQADRAAPLSTRARTLVSDAWDSLRYSTRTRVPYSCTGVCRYAGAYIHSVDEQLKEGHVCSQTDAFPGRLAALLTAGLLSHVMITCAPVARCRVQSMAFSVVSPRKRWKFSVRLAEHCKISILCVEDTVVFKLPSR